MPLKEPSFLILSALATRSLHGYGLVSEVQKLSAGRVRLSIGTLYGALDRLAEEGFVSVDREEVVDGRLRRYYSLTDSGAQALEAEAEHLRANADLAMSMLRKRAAQRYSTTGRLMMSYETWCQLALLAFPRDYRRRRGAEMLTTLLDGARPGHTRPSVRELLTIVDSGWRCRLRLRPGVGPLVLAICSALTAAILGGTAAAWLAWAPHRACTAVQRRG